jgi:formylglycine-generating enzyme required for sulfatase activity
MACRLRKAAWREIKSLVNITFPPSRSHTPVLAIGTGLILGALSGVLLASHSPGVGLVGFALVFGLAARLAYSGEPIAVLIEEGSDSNNEVSEGDRLWVHISGGRFNMGSNKHESEQPIHTITISPFLCMRTPVTRRLYLEVMGVDSRWARRHGR